MGIISQDIAEQVKCLENERNKLANENVLLKNSLTITNNKLDEAKDFIRGTRPVKVYHHAKRRNTTLKFADGECVTVKLKKGEKHCIETAIVYAIAKKIYEKGFIKHLVETVEEKGE